MQDMTDRSVQEDEVMNPNPDPFVGMWEKRNLSLVQHYTIERGTRRPSSSSCCDSRVC